MRISDWQTCALPICKKLSVLAHAYGDGFQMPTPPNGDRVQVPSATAALARLVEWRYNDWGALDARDNVPTPGLHALLGRQSVVWGKRVAVRLDLSGGRNSKMQE